MKNNFGFLNKNNSCINIKNNNININDSYRQNNNEEKYNFNFERIFEKLKEQKNKDNCKNNKNEYYTNLLKNSITHTPFTKIEYLELLYYFNTSVDDKNYIYYLFQKISKYLHILKDNEKDKDLSIFNDIIIKQINFLETEKNYFYALDIIQNDITYKGKNNIVNKIKMEIESKVSSFVKNKQIIFEKLENSQLNKIRDILYNIKDNNNSYDINEILYVISMQWVNKAIGFIDEVLNLNDIYKKNELNKFFELYQVYSSFFHKKKKLICYPGPINNYNIIDHKDIWRDLENEDENYIIRKELLLGKDYCLVKEQDWNQLKELFGATNEIKKKIDNLECFNLKMIILDQRVIKYNKLNLLRPRYIIIGKKLNIIDLKEKIIRIINYTFEKNNNNKDENCNITNSNESNNKFDEKNTNDEDINICDNGIINENKIINNINKVNIYQNNNIEENNIHNIDDDNEYKIHFYKLSKKNRQLLVEIFTSFINRIPSYESINIEKINLKDDNSLDLLFENYNKSTDILLVEVIPKNSYQFLFPKAKSDKDLYQCSICKKLITLKNKYNCEICHFSLYCGKKCAYSQLNKSHLKLHECLNEFIVKKFNLNEFLKLELNTSKYNDGLVGLINLGNTCFINSSLQCLFNTYDLSKYFLTNYFKDEINKKNKLGYNGNIAESYAELLYEIKTTINSMINPINFIKKFFKNNKSLNLSRQQDAQEFLSLLLDSLHEDLNRITNKPYIVLEEQKENEYDSDASKRWWDSYKKREDSIIIDLFHGQFKSKITCLKCKKSSISYEPYLFLGLPIPQVIKEQKIIKFFFGNKCDYLGIVVEEKTTIFDLKKKAIEVLRMNNYQKELSNDELYGIIEIIQVDKNKIVKNIYNNLHKLDLLSSLYEKDDDLEIVLYEKNLDNKYFNIYIYPIKGDEYEKSYPIALSVNEKMTFQEIILNYKEKIISLYTNLHSDDKITIGLLHKINDSLIFYFMNGLNDKDICPLCKKNENSFCKIKDNLKIGEILGKIKKKNENYGPALFVMGNSTKNLNKNIQPDRHFNNGLFFLSDCLKLFCEEELLNNDNLWYCNKCKKHYIAKKQIRLYRLPIYLIIQLKKFKSNYNLFFTTNEKKEIYIKYPINNLDLSDYIEDIEGKKEKYDLYGVIQHHGQITQGHYTSICKINDKWYFFNDSNYKLINNPVTKDAYLLFYKKR